MKITKPEAVQTTQDDPRKGKSRLELRRRPVADLSEKQMEGAAGGGHNTCEPTCCPTCPATCPNTCADTCPAGCCPPTERGHTCPEAICPV